MSETIQEDSFSSDAEFDGEDDESSTDIDAQLEEDDVFDVEFLKCYSALKKKDEKIYNQDVRFFEDHDTDTDKEEEESQNLKDLSQGGTSGIPNTKSNAPRMTLLDHQLAVDPDEIAEPDSSQVRFDLNAEVSKSYYEKELEEIKKSIERVGEEIDSDSDGDLLIVKKDDLGTQAKTKHKLASILDKIEDQEDEDLLHLKKVWSDPDNLSNEDRYLRDYILNKRYLPKSNEDDDDENEDEAEKEGFFSKNIDELSDADDDDGIRKNISKLKVPTHHSDEKNFDKLARIPRNSTKTIRDLVEKKDKKEKRLKKIDKEKKKKKALKDADCEDVVGDLPTKFHYRETEPNDYGLTAEELLLATDEELDKWVSLRDCIAYKTPEEEMSMKKKYAAKRDDIDLKRKIFKSIYEDSADQKAEMADQPGSSEQANLKTKKKKKTRGKKRNRNADSESSQIESASNSMIVDSQSVANDESTVFQVSNRQRKSRSRKRAMKQEKFAKLGVAPDRLLAYGISKTKLKKSKIL